MWWRSDGRFTSALRRSATAGAALRAVSGTRSLSALPAAAAAAIMAALGGAVALGLAAPAALGETAPAALATSAPAWHAVEVRVPTGGSFGILAGVDCRTRSSCVAGGSYDSAAHSLLPMVATESAGRWARARSLRLPADDLTLDSSSTVASVTCPTRTACVAVGNYTATTHQLQGFIAAGHRGRWARARRLAGPANSAAPSADYLTGVSCTGPATCVAVGGYTDTSGNGQALIDTQTSGRWRRAAEIRAPANAAANPFAHLAGVSCARTGDCAAVGAYQTTTGRGEVMAVNEKNGRWGRAVQIRLPVGAHAKPQAELYSVSCTSKGDCVAVGSYVARTNSMDALAVIESGGRWHRAVDVTELPANARQPDPSASLNGVSCTARSCVGVGSYQDDQRADVVMAVTESAGTWGHAVQVSPPSGSATGAGQDSDLFAVSCPGASCTAVGMYTDPAKVGQAMAAKRG